MFSVAYFAAMSRRTGFRPRSLERQMALLVLLHEISRNPLLNGAYALKGGTAINLYWFDLPRLSVDIDLNYIGNADREAMLVDRPRLEEELSRTIEAQGVMVKRIPSEHAGGKWRLQLMSVFGGTFTLELDLNYLLRVPMFGTEHRMPYPLDDDYRRAFLSVSAEELFAGKIVACLDRAAARDLYDVSRLAKHPHLYHPERLRTAVLLFGIASRSDWRQVQPTAVEAVTSRMMETDLQPLIRTTEQPDLEVIRLDAVEYLAGLIRYRTNELDSLNRFYEEGVYDPRLLLLQAEEAERLASHPAILWKLQHHRRYRGME